MRVLVNTDLTVYNRSYDTESKQDTWRKQYVPEAWKYKSEQSSLSSEGRNSADVYTIRIPDTSVTVKKGDCIVFGNCDRDISTIKDLRGLEYVKVSAANYNTFGNNPHIKVTGV